ncbi:hypothetical protein B5G43_08740 [Flavonifractor sp. An92]|uniref:S26 family signal peptidase n=1 Tax=Flavonifractor sp. An92 TaxID=1965666 RepID=UPI000B391BD1|nr:S26 family signal peptidase [Flavonifractor sp. An92]OUN06488.1 hypothetical protein B5G43_08740 [Flavonifractor sp. An92]
MSDERKERTSGTAVDRRAADFYVYVWNGKEQEGTMRRIGDDRNTVRNYVELAIALVIVCAIMISGVRITFVIGPSMLPTLQEYSWHVVVGVQDPEVGDIVTFRLPDEKFSYIKRIVAGPGDTVDHWGTAITLGEDEYYVLGDNRGNSRDSRAFGPITGEIIWGRLIF